MLAARCDKIKPGRGCRQHDKYNCTALVACNQQTPHTWGPQRPRSVLADDGVVSSNPWRIGMIRSRARSQVSGLFAETSHGEELCVVTVPKRTSFTAQTSRDGDAEVPWALS